MDLRWRVNPLKQFTLRAVLALIIAGCALYLLYLSEKNSGWVALATLLFISALHDLLFPTEYIFSKQGITVKHGGRTRLREWDEFKRFHLTDKGVFLGTFARYSRLDHYRGLLLIFNEQTPEKEVLEAIRHNINAGGGEKARAESSETD